MKTRLLFATALAILATPVIASAEEYAKAGQLEAGGTFGIVSQTETTKPDGGGSETEDTVMAIQVDPTVGYFVANGFELLGQLHLTQATLEFDGVDDKATLTEIGLGAGAGYFLNLGIARVGPQAILRFGTGNFVFGDLKQTDSLLGAQVGGFAKVPVGGGGVIAAGVVVDYDTITRNEDNGVGDRDSEGTNTEFGVRLGYFVYF
jgi:hypothetical protein